MAVTTAYPSCDNSCACEHTSKTYFSVIPAFNYLSPEQKSLHHSPHQAKRVRMLGGSLHIVPFAGRSTHSAALGSYFMPFCKNTVTVTEQFTPRPVNTVYAPHFNIFTQRGTFESIVRLEPRHSFAGIGFEYEQNCALDQEKNHTCFVRISCPIIQVQHDLNLTEQIVDDGGGPDLNADEQVMATMRQAFAQAEWSFGKIVCNRLRETRIADIELTLGHACRYEACATQLFVGVKVPTGNKPHGVHLFEPVIGSGRSVGIICGSNCTLHLWQRKNSHMRLIYSHQSEYLFTTQQIRSFDLKYKPWSRYMEVYANKEEATAAATLALSNPTLGAHKATPGINVFTKDMQVTPGFRHAVLSSLVFETDKGIGAELGYRFLYRQQECVSLACPWQEGPALKYGLTGAGNTTTIRDITGTLALENSNPAFIVPVANYDESLIKAEQLDLHSAAHPCVATHTFYGAAGRQIDAKGVPLYLGLGGSYECANRSNAALNRWMFWFKTDVSF